jgi:adenine-specific DNA-methyltransferase
MFGISIQSESDLVGVALALGARNVPGWSPQENRLAAGASPVAGNWLGNLAKEIQEGADPLGTAFIRLRSPENRRIFGATFTPKPIVTAMLQWTKTTGIEPARIVEPGSGSGRFLMMAARLFARAQLVGVELDPLAAMMPERT